MKTKKFSKIISILFVFIFLFSLFSGCVGNNPSENGEIKVITTLFPQYDFTRQICGEEGDVTLLLSPGTDSHSFDPTPKDVSNILSCDVFIYTGDEMEPWVASVLKSVGNDVTVIDLSKSVTLMESDHNHHHNADPHFWLDMKNSVKMVDVILKVINEKDSKNADLYSKRADALKNELNNLDAEFSNVINESNNTIVFGGRFAYYYFVKTYSLKYKTVYDTCSVNVEPSAKTVTNIVKFVEDNDIKYIYHEELTDPKTARSIAESTGATLLEFSTAHNVSKDDFSMGVTFIDIMKKNLENLKKGLN